jgi:hypothetical protein
MKSISDQKIKVLDPRASKQIKVYEINRHTLPNKLTQKHHILQRVERSSMRPRWRFKADPSRKFRHHFCSDVAMRFNGAVHRFLPGQTTSVTTRYAFQWVGPYLPACFPIDRLAAGPSFSTNDAFQGSVHRCTLVACPSMAACKPAFQWGGPS